MDTFIDKLAQRFSAQDMIRANLAAEAKETRKLREKMESYESLLQEMRQINLKNMESAERVNRILQEGTFADKEHLQELFAEKEELLTAGFTKMEEALHTENVKVYRNVQASVVEELNKQTESLSQQVASLTTKTKSLMGLAAASVGVSAISTIAVVVIILMLRGVI